MLPPPDVDVDPCGDNRMGSLDAHMGTDRNGRLSRVAEVMEARGCTSLAFPNNFHFYYTSLLLSGWCPVPL